MQKRAAVSLRSILMKRSTRWSPSASYRAAGTLSSTGSSETRILQTVTVIDSLLNWSARRAPTVAGYTPRINRASNLPCRWSRLPVMTGCNTRCIVHLFFFLVEKPHRKASVGRPLPACVK